MKRLILSADIHSIDVNDSTIKYCHAIKIAYASAWNVDYKYIQYKPNIEGRHSNWTRIPLLHKFMDEFDEILWLDSDIVITDMKTDYFELFNPKRGESSENLILCAAALDGKGATSMACLYKCREKSKFKEFLNDWWNDAHEVDISNNNPSIVWNETWKLNDKRQSEIVKIDLDISQELNGKLFKVHEKYNLIRKPLVKKYYFRILNKCYKKKRIGIVMRDQNFYSNGAGQNCIFIRHSLEAAGYDVDFVTNNEFKLMSSELPYRCLEFSTLNIDEYCLFIFGTQTLLKQNIEKIRAKGVNCIMFNPCNVLDAFHMENFLYVEKKEKTPLFEMTFHTFSDEVWLTDSQKDSSFEYLQVINRCKIPITLIPFTWEPLFLQKNGEIPRYIQRGKGRKVDIVIVEPNLGYCKSGWLPLIICETFYLHYPEKLNKVYFFCAPKKNETALGMIQSLKIGEDGKIRLMDRMPINDILSFFANPVKNEGNHVLFVSHNINLPLNYAYFDILYCGFPFLHNSHVLKEKNIGYYYSGILDGAKHISEVIDSYEVEENIHKNHEYLHKLDSYNPEVINEFGRIITNSIKSKVEPPTLMITEI